MAARSLERDEPAPLQGKIDRDSHLPKPKRARRRNELELLADTRGPLPLHETRRPAHRAAITSTQKNVGAIKGTGAPARINARFRVVKRTTKPKRAKIRRQIDKLFGVGKGVQDGGSGGVKEASTKLDADGSLGDVKTGTMLGSDHADYYRAKDALEEQELGRNEMVDFVQNALETHARVLSDLPRPPTIPISPQEKIVAHKHARSPEPEEAQGMKRQQTYRAASRDSHDRDRRRSSNNGFQESPSVQGSPPPRVISRAHDLVPETETDSFPSYVRNRALSSAKFPSTPTLKREERHLSSENISPISELLPSPDSPMFVDSSPYQPTEGADAALDSTGTANTSRRESRDGSKTDEPELAEHELTLGIQSPVTEEAKPRSVLRSDDGQLPEKPSAEVANPDEETVTDGELKQDGENSQRQKIQIPSEIAAAPNTMATDGLAQGSTPLRISTRDSPRRSLGGIRTDLVSSRSYTLKSPPGTPGSCEPSSRPPTPPPQHVDISDIDLGVAAQPRLESPLRTAASAEDDAMEESEPAPPTQQEIDQIPGIRSTSSYGSDESAKEAAEPLSSGAVRMPFADMGQEPHIAAARGISSPSRVVNPFHSGQSPPKPATNPFRAATESPKPAYNPFQATHNPFSAATRDDTPPSILVGEKPLPPATNESEEAQTLPLSRPPPSPEHGALSIQFHPLRGFTVGIALDPDTSATDAMPTASSSTLPPRNTDGASVAKRTPQPSSSWTNLRVPTSGVQLVRAQPEADDGAKIPLRPLAGRLSPAASGSTVGKKTSVEVAEASLESMTGEEDEEEREGEEWKEEKEKGEEEDASVVEEEIVHGEEGEGDVETTVRADDAQHDDGGEEDYYMSDDADLYSTGDEPPNDSVGTERRMSDEERQQQRASESQDQTDQPIEQVSDTDAHTRADDQDDDEYIIPYNPASPLIDKPAPPPPAQTVQPSPPLWADGIPGLAYSRPPTATTGASAEAAADPASGDAIDGDKLDDDEMEDLFGSEE